MAARTPFPWRSAVALVVLWAILTGFRVGSAVVAVGGLAAAIATLAVLSRGEPGSRLAFAGSIRFAGFFLWESLVSGVDVALRVLRPRVRIAPGFHEYRLRLPDGPARLFFVNALSLMPGTLSADLRSDTVLLHVLDVHRLNPPGLERLEGNVASAFGLALQRRA